ncbi:glutamate--tRNA ligase [Kitasatospora sp. NPDC048545]|uniref:glutamate--tRNA ligase n=1 Tax=Kitasatospora sp. NPDC048545 TaxID=3157208 RepID=UPI0033E3CF1C
MVVIDTPVRVRIAPSPTGMFHVGNARSLLLNWIVARQSGGTLVLRIEDTDAARSRPEWTQGILDAMAWLGVGPDQYEGPYFQTEYAHHHQKAVEQLLSEDKAYFCDCTREQLAERTGDSRLGYDGFCRDRSLERADGRAVRFRTPDDGVTIVTDIIRGNPTFENSTIEDFVIARSDGTSVFLLANVVDDMTMGIDLVIRAEEHLSNTPKQQLLWQALGKSAPRWAHAPILVNEKRQKLSKRRDRVALEDFRDEGYLSEAMRNYLMLLGWAPANNREIVPWSEMEEEFRLEDVNPAPTFFDVKKLRAFNGEYIRALALDEFIAACRPWLTRDNTPWSAEAYDEAVFSKVAELAQTRITLLSEIVEIVDFLFLDEPVDDAPSWAKAMKEGSAELLKDVSASFKTVEWQAGPLKSELERLSTLHGMKLGKAQAPVRVAVTGRTVGLPLFESLEVLGRERTTTRLFKALEKLGS